MPVRNGYKSHNGRSAVARKVLRGGAGKVNGMMPQKEVWTVNAGYVNGNTYFGGPKKGGLAPTATGFMRPNGVARRGPRGTENYLFEFAGYNAQKALPESDCQGNCQQGLDYLVKSVWSWSFFMDEYANVTYTNTDVIQPSINASFIVDKVSAFTKSNLSPAPSTNGLHWLHRQSQERYVISFSDDNNHNFSDKVPAILIGDILHFAIGSNHGWHPESQWNNGEFFSGKIAALANNDGSAFNGNIVWSRPLNSKLVTNAVSRAVTLNNNENDVGPNLGPRVDLRNTRSLYQFVNSSKAPLSAWNNSLVGSPYKLDVTGYYGNSGGGDSGSIPFVEIPNSPVDGISPVYNKLYLTFGEFNEKGEFYLIMQGYYADWSSPVPNAGLQMSKNFVPDLKKWKAIPDKWGRKKEVILSIGGATFQPYFAGDAQVYVGGEVYKGKIPPTVNSNVYPTTEQLVNGWNNFQKKYNNVFDGVDIDLESISRDAMGKVYVDRWKAFFNIIQPANIVSIVPEAAAVSIRDYSQYFGQRQVNGVELQYIDRFLVQFYNNGPDALTGYLNINWIEWGGSTPNNWQQYGTGDYSTMSAWEYAMRKIYEGARLLDRLVGACPCVPASTNAAGNNNVWDYNLLAQQIFIQGTPAGLNNAKMREMRENKPIIQIGTWAIECDASTNGDFAFSNAMKALLDGTIPPPPPSPVEPWCNEVPVGYPNAGKKVCCPGDIPYKHGDGSVCHNTPDGGSEPTTKSCALYGNTGLNRCPGS
jgi:hypothetical protein